MGDDLEQQTSEGPESTLPAPASEEKPRRRTRRAGEARSPGLVSTTEGAKVREILHERLIEMMNAAALTEAKRRRATAIDTTDCEAAFDRLVGLRRRETAISIVADVANALGSGLIGYAINIYTGSAQDWPKGHLAMGGGVAFVLISIILKYVTWGR